MEKRWLVLVLALALPGVWGDLSTHTTEQDGQVVLNYPEQVSLGEPFGVIITYYRINQLVEAARVRLVRAGEQVFSADATSSAPVRATLTESESGRIQYLLLVDEQLPGDIRSTTTIPFAIQTVGSELLQMTTEHEAVVVSGGTELYFDDLSAYEPFSLRGSFKYLVSQKNTDEVDCVLTGTQVEFRAAPEFLGDTACQITGKVLNTSILHTYTLHVVPDKKVVMKDLPDIRLVKGTENATVLAENFTAFCQYEVPSGLTPLIYFRNTYPHFELGRRGPDLVLASLDPAWTGEEAIRIGCHDQAQVFRLIVGRRLLQEGAPLAIAENGDESRYALRFEAGELVVSAPATVLLSDEAPALVAALTLAEATDIPSNLTLRWPPNQSLQVTCTENPCQLSAALTRAFPGLTEYALSADVALTKAIAMDQPLASGRLKASEGLLSITHLKTVSFQATESPSSPVSGLDPSLGVLAAPLEGGAATAALRLAKLANATLDFEELNAQVAGAHRKANITKRLEPLRKTDALGRPKTVTRVTIRIEPASPLTLRLIEYVPKASAPTAGHIAFDEGQTAPAILLLDPVVGWSLTDLRQPLELAYELPSETNQSGITLPLLVRQPPLSARTTLLAVLGVAAVAVLWWSGLVVVRRARKARQAAPAKPLPSDAAPRSLESPAPETASTPSPATASPPTAGQAMPDVLTELLAYVRALRRAGLSRPEIKARLVDASWPPDVADAVLDHDAQHNP